MDAWRKAIARLRGDHVLRSRLGATPAAGWRRTPRSEKWALELTPAVHGVTVAELTDTLLPAKETEEPVALRSSPVCKCDALLSAEETREALEALEA